MNEADKKTEAENNPDARLKDTIKRYPKAQRVQRLAAKLIDILLNWTALVPLTFALGLDSYGETGELPPMEVVIQFHIAMFVTFVIINGWLIYRYGQTVGKRVMKIAIATQDFQVPAFNRVVLIRHLPFAIALVVPGLTLINILDWLLIMRKDRRCLHDIVAGTQVIDVSQAG